MLTSSLVTLVKKDFPDWSRTMILTFINEIQKIVFTKEATKLMRMYDSSTGKDPVLSTSDGTYLYNIYTILQTGEIEYNAWRVTDIYSSNIEEPILTVEKFDAVSNGTAKVLFTENPKTSTYYFRAYRFPIDIDSENVQLEVPSAYHITHIYEGICGLIEKYRSGRSDRWEKFESILLPDIIKRMSDSNNIYNVNYKGY